MVNYIKAVKLMLALLILAVPLSATKYAGEIFAISPGVLSSAMGGTGLTYANSQAAGWWNPALLAFNSPRGLELMRSQHFEGLMDQNQLSLILGGKTRSSISLNHLVIDKIKLTQLENPNDSLSNDNRPIVWKTVSNQDFILSGGLARAVNDNLALGVSPKIAYRNLAEHSGYAFGADLGLLWQLSPALNLGANLRDFFSTQVLWDSGEHDVITPNLDLEFGIAISPIAKIPLHLAIRSEVRAEESAGTVEGGIFSADFHAGILAQPIPALRVMGGYDVDAWTAGIAVAYRQFGLNYAFRNASPDGLGYSQRISATYQW